MTGTHKSESTLQNKPPLPVSRDEVELGFPMHFQVMETSCFNMPSYATNGNLLYLLNEALMPRGASTPRNRESRTVLGSCDNDVE